MVDEWDERAFEDEFPTFDDEGQQTALQLQQRRVGCPYCGESIEILLDASVPDQQYIEDCSVCCRPINISVSEDVSGELLVQLGTGDDVW